MKIFFFCRSVLTEIQRMGFMRSKRFSLVRAFTHHLVTSQRQYARRPADFAAIVMPASATQLCAISG